MNVSGMLEDLNREIARLSHIRDLLGATATPPKPGPGRPKGSGKPAATAGPDEADPKRRIMSAEARERIAAAQRKRWAAGKKASTSAAKPGIVKTIRATPPMAKKAVESPQPAKKSPRPVAKQASGKTAPPKKATRQIPAKKQASVKLPPPAPETTETATAGE